MAKRARPESQVDNPSDLLRGMHYECDLPAILAAPGIAPSANASLRCVSTLRSRPLNYIIIIVLSVAVAESRFTACL